MPILERGERDDIARPGDAREMAVRRIRFAEIGHGRERFVEPVALRVAAARREHRQSGIERRTDAGDGILEGDAFGRVDAEPRCRE